MTDPMQGVPREAIDAAIKMLDMQRAGIYTDLLKFADTQPHRCKEALEEYVSEQTRQWLTIRVRKPEEEAHD